MILLPYDRGCPHLLWREGQTAVISEDAARALRDFGIGLSSEYTLSPQGKPLNPRSTYPSPVTLDLAGALKAADEGRYKISLKARSLLK